MFGYPKRLVSISVILASSLVSACVASNTASTPSPDAVRLANASPPVLDEIPADSVSESDVINRSKTHVRRTGEIYLMRGLANVFSRGIDEMARELRKRGYDAANFSYSQWQPIANDIVARSKKRDVSYPVIIVGHSLGGNESSKFANYLAANDVNTSLVVTFDPVETGYVGKGIDRVINYYLPKSPDNRIVAKQDFKGKLSNVDVTVDPDITHTNVDKNPEFQTATLTSIANITGKLRPKVARKTQPDR